MANFATNRILHIYHSIESHLFLVSTLVLSAHSRSSMARKRYSSSGPVRYIPGRFAKVQKARNCESLQGSEFRNLDGKRLRNSRFNDEISSRFDEPTPLLFDTDYKNMMDEPNTISKADVDELRKTREEIEHVAAGLLAARAMTAIELRKKLRGKKISSDMVESVVTDFKSRGLLNDGMYAESFTRSRWLSSTWGPRRIKQALLQKGVSETETKRAIKQVFEEEEEDDTESDCQNRQQGMCKLSMDRLYLQASKQWLRCQDAAAVGNRRARIVRWLQYRGFDWGVTSYILKKLESQYPP